MTDTIDGLRVGNPVRRAHRWIDRWFDRPGSVRSLALLRIALGPIVVLHLWPFITQAVEGRSFRDRFHEPWFSMLPNPPGGVQTALVVAGVVGAVAMTVGWRTRAATALALIGVAGNLFLDQTHFRHNRAFLVLLLLGLNLGNSGRILSLDARRRRREGRTVVDADSVWSILILRYLAATVYFASGLSKLVDRDWRSGRVLWDRSVRYQDFARDARLPFDLGETIADIVVQRWVHTITSPIAVAMELFIAFAIWSRRTRLAAIWVAIFFHLSIEVSAQVEVFSLAAISALVIWATPRTRDRLVEGEGLGWVRRLDWLARFETVERAGPLRVTDRDGAILEGRAAKVLLASRLPLTFFVAAPLRLFVR